LALDPVFGGARLAHPVVALAAVVIGQEPFERAVLLLNPLAIPAFDRRAHGRANVHPGNAGAEWGIY
jgi:hypothetical protein